MAAVKVRASWRIALPAMSPLCTAARASNSSVQTWDYVRVVGVANDPLSIDIDVQVNQNKVFR